MGCESQLAPPATADALSWAPLLCRWCSSSCCMRRNPPRGISRSAHGCSSPGISLTIFWCFECWCYRKGYEFNFNVGILIYILKAIGKWYKLYAEGVKQYLDAERVSPSNLHLFNVSVQKYSKWKLRYSGFYKVVSYVWISMLFECYKKGYKKKRCHRVRLLDFCALFFWKRILWVCTVLVLVSRKFLTIEILSAEWNDYLYFFILEPLSLMHCPPPKIKLMLQ